MFTRFAFTLVTKLGTRMRAIGSPFSTTYLSTGMGLNISFVLRLFKFSTETIVFGHKFVEFELALGTGPCEDDFVFVLVFVDIENPGFDAFKVH